LSDGDEDIFQRRSIRLPRSETSGGALAEYSAFGLEEYFGEVLPTLSFRLKDGRQFAKPYHRLDEVSFDPSHGVGLEYPDVAITLRGRNLAPLYVLICAYKVRWVQEAGRALTLLVPESETVVEAITRGPGQYA
jgi:hypothetical protein